MNSLEDIPFKLPMGSLEAPLEEMKPFSAPELSVPDYHQALHETKYVFCLEKWVLTALQGSCSKRSTSPSRLPSCPPYWLMFSSPQPSRLDHLRGGEVWETSGRERSRSLSAADARGLHPRVTFLISDSEGEGGYSEDDEHSSSSSADEKPERLPSPRQRGPQDLRPGSAPHPSTGSTRPRKISPLALQDNRRASLPPVEPPLSCSPQYGGQRRPKRKPLPLGRVSRRHSLTPQPSCSSPTSRSPPRPSTAEQIRTVKGHKPSPRLPVSRPLGSHGTSRDSSVELLRALGQEERDLLEAIMEQGYPLRTAVLALQKSGSHRPEQILSYLLTCDRLCRLGHDETQVQEALEMFQNCEAKAAEFLHLLAQFNEMGFQQSTIKEVLLVHENHRERALEELMARGS